MFASLLRAQKVSLIAVLVTTLTGISGQAQTINVTNAEITYNIQGTYTPSGGPVESINYSNTLNLLTQPTFDFSINPWGGGMDVDFHLTQGSPTALFYGFGGNALFPMNNPASYDVAAETNFNYSILFELDSAALLDLGLTYTGYSNPLAYSPLAPSRDASFMFEYLGLNGWEVLATHNGTTYIAQAVDFYQIVGPGTYRITGSGLSHNGLVDAHGSVSVAAPVPVPEPSGAMLAMLTGMVLAFSRRRKQQ